MVLHTGYLKEVNIPHRCGTKCGEEKTPRKDLVAYSLTFDKSVRSPTAVRTLIANGARFLTTKTSSLTDEDTEGNSKRPSRPLFLMGIAAMNSKKKIGRAALREKSSRISNLVRTGRAITLMRRFFRHTSIVWSRLIPDEAFSSLQWWQRLNHFPGRHILGHKDKIAKLFENVQRLLPTRCTFDMMPESFVLSGPLEEHPSLLKALQADDKAVWIRKPCVSSMGRGIRVFQAASARSELNDVDKESSNTWCVVQRYVSNPYLVDGKKADMRVYVLVTSFDPLVVYLAEDGIVKFCTSDFDLSADKMKVREIHLANQAINKFSPDFVLNQDIASGSRWTHAGYWGYLAKRHGTKAVLAAKERLVDLVAKTFAAAVPHVVAETKRLRCESNLSNLSCFEIFGLDVELDAHLVPHLLEVNVAPEIMVRPGDAMSMQVVGRVASDAFHITGIRAKPRDGARRPRVCENALPSTAQTVLASCNADEAYQLAELENQFERSQSTIFRRAYPRKDRFRSVSDVLTLASDDRTTDDRTTLPRRQELLQRWEHAMRPEMVSRSQ